MASQLTGILLANLILALVYGLLYRQYREHSLLLWALAWGTFGLRYLAEIGNFLQPDNLWLKPIVAFFTLASSFLLLWGSSLFFRKGLSNHLVAILVILASLAWLVSSGLIFSARWWTSLPVLVLHSTITIWTGILFFNQPKKSGIGCRFIGGTLMIWGIHRLDYPWRLSQEFFGPLAFHLSEFLSLASALGILLVYLDRTRSLAEETAENLLHTNQNLQNIIATAPTAIIAVDTQGIVTLWNHAATRLFGWLPEEAIGRPNPIIPIEQQEDFCKHLASLITTPVVQSKEVQRQRKNGALVDVTRMATPLLDQHGNRVGALAIFVDNTERKKLELATRQTAEQYQALFEMNNFPMLLIDPGSGAIIDANRAASFFYGYSQDELRNMTVKALNTASPEEVASRMQQVIRGEADSFSFKHRLAHGEIRNVEVFASLIRINERALICSIIHDISKRLRMENELRHSEHRYRTLLENLGDTLLVHDLEGNILDVNDLACSRLGYSRSELLFMTIDQVIVPNSGKDLPGLWNHLEPQEKKTFEAQHHLKNGSNYPIEVRLRRLELPDGPAILALAQDISERKQAQAALLQSEARFRRLSQEFHSLLDGIPDAIMLLSPTLEIVWANKGAAKLAKRDPGSLPGQQCYHCIMHSDAACQNCPVQDSFKTGEMQTAKVQTPDGRVWGVKAFPQFNADNQVSGVIEVASDITERMKLRDETMRTSRLAALGELAAGVAHEINNPNGLILLNLGTLHETINEALPILDDHAQQNDDFRLAGLPYSRMREELPAIIDEVQDASRRIKRTVEDLKNFARSRSNDETEEIDLNQAVQTALRLVDHTLRKMTNNLHVDLTTEGCFTQGTGQAIEQVLVNLLLNASQALTDPSQGISVYTRCDERRKTVSVAIKDEGCGISPEQLSQVTDPFFTTKRTQGGTGLGLSVSARIIKDHHGSLDIASLPGAGTTMTITFPASGQN